MKWVGLLVAASALAACVGTIGDGEDEGLAAGGEDPFPGTGKGSWTSRRLTKEQYGHTVEDVLGIDLGEALDRLPDEPRIDGFTNSAVGLVVTSDHVDAYFELAELVAEMLDASELASRYAGCATLGDGACERAFVSGFGEAMFRRPLRDDEVSSFATLFDTAAAEGLSFEAGIRLVVEAMLQSPAFLYLLEEELVDAEVRKVVGYEMASRLSYLVWQSAPDEVLLAKAAAGGLDTRDGVLREVDRMLGESIAPRATSRFVRDWFALDGLDDAVRQDLTAAMAGQLKTAAVQTYQAHIAGGDRLSAVLDSARAHLPGFVAEWYGLSPVDAGIAPYDLSAVAERRGLLTHPGPMTTISDRDIGGLVARGLFVMEHVLCKQPLSPPPDINLSDFTSHLGPGATERDYSADRLSNDACAGCHGQFDPLAYAFERFDGIGRYALHDEHGNALREDGVFEGVPFDTVGQYVSLLAEDERVQRCVTKKHLMFALGVRGEELGDEIDQVHQLFVEGGGTYEAMIRAIVGHDVFRIVAVEGGAQ